MNDVVGELSLPAHARELWRALEDRLRALEDELDDLVGKNLGGDALPSAHGRATLGSGMASTSATHNVASDLLNELRTYPAWMRDHIERRLQRVSRPQIQIYQLRKFARDVVDATSQIQHWFAAPHTGEIPTALDDAMRKGMAALEISERRGMITAGDADQLDTVVDDARLNVFQTIPLIRDVTKADGPAGGSASGSDVETPDYWPIAIFRVPAHEASSPRFWPVVLGHELAHLRLQTLEEQHSETDRISAGLSPNEDAPTARQVYLLDELDILDDFDIEALKTVIANESAETGVKRPPPPGLGEPGEPSPGSRTSYVVDRLKAVNDWVVEVVCDLDMVRRYGPAGVAAMCNYLSAVGAYTRSELSHPPGYFRAAMMLDYLGDHVPDDFDTVLNPWRTSPAVQARQLPPEPWVRLVLEFIESHKSALQEFVDEWPGERYDVKDLDRRAGAGLAVNQLKFGIPPFSSAIGDFTAQTDELTTDTETSRSDETKKSRRVLALDNADVINAGWIAVTQPPQDPPAVHPKIPVDRLLLKSIETLQLLDEKPELRYEPAQVDSTPRPAAVPAGAILGPDEIIRRLDAPQYWRRVILSPRIPDDRPSASIDLRLGNRFIIFQRTGISSFNAARGNNARAVQRFVERPFYSPFVLHPGEVVLASALEYLALPADVGAQVITRSSYGRLGLITATAVQVHPLYRGCLTLELVNLGTVPLTLYPGERVAQLVFFSVHVSDADSAPDPEQLFRGSYICPTSPEFPDVAVDQWVKGP